MTTGSPPVESMPLVVFDFDGVLMDGMPEYWWSARAAALLLAPGLVLPPEAPAGFARLRPLIHKGWEMVLMAAELGRDDLDLDALLADYGAALPVALARWGWHPEQLQLQLERVRAEAIAEAPAAWLARHRLYPGVKERLERLGEEGARWAVLTTKGAAFASRLLAAVGLEPWALYGHEQGSKPEVLRQLLGQQRPLWFVEDRRPTLETVRADSRLASVRCFLVSWGYLGPQDAQHLPTGIGWLTPERFAAPLAQWP
jgi:phosphoglycolate phosphatase-like HAD superfamily hydrolase